MPQIKIEENPQLSLRNIFHKDISFECFSQPDYLAPQVLHPSIKMIVDTHYVEKSQHFFEVSTEIRLDADDQGKKLFILEVEIVGVFQIKGVTGFSLDELLNIVCPEMIFPYLRETIDYLLNKGNFPALRLVTINFETIYRNKKRFQK